LRPGDRLDGEIGAELVAAPGHTPGQLVVWIPTHRTLIAGDALATHDGALLSESSTLTPTTRRKQPRGCSTSFGHPGSAWLMERHSQATSAAGSTPPRRCAFK
jgi:glyoxylase-like metal-dependent hydrolase (beta-lactamase superfamily II)